MRNATPREKREAIEKLGKLLDCAGTALAWEEMNPELNRLPTPVINALIYRVERARAQAFEEGQQHSGDGAIVLSDTTTANA
jgi:hypothetical protein